MEKKVKRKTIPLTKSSVFVFGLLVSQPREESCAAFCRVDLIDTIITVGHNLLFTDPFFTRFV
jgi:hypothetical protein